MADLWYAQDDARLLQDCEQHSFSGSGPGGQHRNRHSAGVRLVHRETGCEATCIEHRSAQANRLTALRRLRLALALAQRHVVPREAIAPFVVRGRLSIGPSAANYPLAVAVVLDAVHEQSGSLRATADLLGVSTTQLVKLLTADKAVRQAANALRAEFGASPLRT